MYNIGVDLGGTNIACAVVDEKGKIIKKSSRPTLADRANEVIIADMADLCKELIAECGLEAKDIHSVGVGSPGIADGKKGIIIYNNNLGFENVNVKEELKKHLDIEVYVDNDANAAAFGEYEFGIGKKYKDIVAITLGTGIGGGVVLDGKIMSGSFGGGAELGHIVINMDGYQCTCGRVGCWEMYSSGTALIRDAMQSARDNINSALYKAVDGDLSKMNAKIPFDLAAEGDVFAKAIIDEYINNLAKGLANVVNIFQPEVIVLGGGISAQGEVLLKPLREKIAAVTYGGPEMFRTKLEIATLGNDAGIIGAAFLYKQF